MIYEFFRVTGANDSVDNYADLFTIGLRNDDIQEFDSKWDGILSSMTKIPSDDILEGLYKSRIRESEKLTTVLELYDLETHHKKLGPDHHRLKTMVKRSIEQDLRIRNFEGTEIMKETPVVKNQGTKQREQRTLGDCWQWKTNGQCSKGDNCSFRHDFNKRAKKHSRIRLRILSCSRVKERRREPEVPEGRVPVVECLDGLARITLKELAPVHSLKNGILPECLFYKAKSGCRFGEKCSYAHRQVDEQPTKRSKKNNGKSAVAMLKKGNWQEREPVTDECHDRPGKPVKRSDKKLGQNSSKRQLSDARQLGCVFQDMKPSKSSSILRKSSDIRKPIRCVKFAKAVARHADIRDQNPSLGLICSGEPHERSPNAPKF